MSTCYGTTRYGKLEACRTCEHAAYCIDASDERSYAIEYNDEVGPIVYDAHHDDVPLPDETPETPAQTLRAESAYLLRQFLREIVHVSNADPVRIYIIIGKLGGLSHSAIGRSCGMTKQAISKHCQELERKSQFLGDFLKMKFACDEELARTFSKFTHDIRRNDGRRFDLKIHA